MLVFYVFFYINKIAETWTFNLGHRILRTHRDPRKFTLKSGFCKRFESQYTFQLQATGQFSQRINLNKLSISYFFICYGRNIREETTSIRTKVIKITICRFCSSVNYQGLTPLRSQKLNKEMEMISSDGVNVFPSIPPPDSGNISENILIVNNIICIDKNYLSFSGTIFSSSEGLIMGNP